MVPLSCLVHRSARGRSGKTTTTDHRFNIGSESCLCETGYGRLLAGVGGRLRGGTGNILVGGTRQRGLHRQFALRGDDPTAFLARNGARRSAIGDGAACQLGCRDCDFTIAGRRHMATEGDREELERRTPVGGAPSRGAATPRRQRWNRWAN